MKVVSPLVWGGGERDRTNACLNEEERQTNMEDERRQIDVLDKLAGATLKWRQKCVSRDVPTF